MNMLLTTDLTPTAMLSELASLGMQAARVVARLMAIEQQAADVVATWLPEVGVEPGSLSEAAAVGQGLDGVAAAMAQAVPRVEMLSRALERVSRSVRRCVALGRRIEAGWPRVARVDDRAAMVRRQVARKVGEAIRRTHEGEAAERLFDELAERLDDPAVTDEVASMPVDEVVRQICRDLGLADATIAAITAAQSSSPGVKGTTVPLRGAGQRPAAPRPNNGPHDSC